MNFVVKFGRIGRIGAFVVSIFLLHNCKKQIEEPPLQDTIEYQVLSYENVVRHLEFPSGLCQSKKKAIKNLEGVGDELIGILATGPTFQNLYANGGFRINENPKIFRFTSDLTKSPSDISIELDLTLLTEIDLGKYPSDFDSFAYSGFPDSLWRARGLILNGLELIDGQVLCSSNSSDKLFMMNEIGQIDIFIQDERLSGITKIIQGIDENIYIAEVENLDETDSSLIISPKRIIKISPKDKSINVEFELPSTLDFDRIFQDYPGQLKKEASFTERLKICENSYNGKEKYGFKFYVSDLLKNRIYGIDEQNKVEIIAENIRFPYLLGIDSIGNIFYATSPLSKGLFYPVEIRYINPETHESKTVFTFKETLLDYLYTRGFEVIGEDGRRGWNLLVGFDISGIIRETGDTLELIVTNSHRGTLDRILLKEISN